MNGRVGLVVGVGCSPRRGGNSDLALDRFLAGAGDAGARVVKISLADLDFSPCLECARVNRDGTCRVVDGMQRVYGPVLSADALALAAPVFFGGLCAQAKMMIDRFQCYWLGRNVFRTVHPAGAKKKGVFIAVQATGRRDFFLNARAVVKNFFATVDAEYSGEIFCPGVESMGDILTREGCLSESFELGRTTGRQVIGSN